MKLERIVAKCPKEELTRMFDLMFESKERIKIYQCQSCGQQVSGYYMRLSQNYNQLNKQGGK